jgi:hypothetical protein
MSSLTKDIHIHTVLFVCWSCLAFPYLKISLFYYDVNFSNLIKQLIEETRLSVQCTMYFRGLLGIRRKIFGIGQEISLYF